jgi:hypothetical protein
MAPVMRFTLTATWALNKAGRPFFRKKCPWQRRVAIGRHHSPPNMHAAPHCYSAATWWPLPRSRQAAAWPRDGSRARRALNTTGNFWVQAGVSQWAAARTSGTGTRAWLRRTTRARLPGDLVCTRPEPSLASTLATPATMRSGPGVKAPLWPRWIYGRAFGWWICFRRRDGQLVRSLVRCPFGYLFGQLFQLAIPDASQHGPCKTLIPCQFF